MLRLPIFILSFAATGTAMALTLSFERAPEYALTHNPTLSAARLRIEEARARLTGAGRLANPEMEVEFSQNIRMPERSLGIALMQRFPLTARLRLERAISQTQLAAAQAEVADAERRLVAELRTATVKYLALTAQRELRRQQLANSRDQSEFVARRAAAGEASAVEVAQLGLEGQQLTVEMLQLDTARATLSGELRLLLGAPPGEAVAITGDLAAPGAPPKREAGGENRPDLAAARHTADAARQAVGLARARKWEDVGVGLTAGGERTEDAPDGLSNDYFLGLKLSVPLPLWNRNEGGIAEASAAAARAGKEADALAFQIHNEAETARSEMAALARLVAEMDGALLPKAAQLEEQLRAAYATGQTPLTEVLRARARRLELSQRRVDAVRDFHLARVRYDAALGRFLHRIPKNSP